MLKISTCHYDEVTDGGVLGGSCVIPKCAVDVAELSVLMMMRGHIIHIHRIRLKHNHSANPKYLSERLLSRLQI